MFSRMVARLESLGKGVRVVSIRSLLTVYTALAESRSMRET